MTIKRVNIYDLDGTIIDSTHRYRTIIGENGERIDLQHWRDNQHLAVNDALLPLAAQYMADLVDPETYVIVATAREMHAPDWQFIRDNLGLPDYFISRKHGSNESGKTLKANGIARFFNLVNFRGAEFTFFEDNAEYLKYVCDRFNIKGVYVPSKQGY